MVSGNRIAGSYARRGKRMPTLTFLPYVDTAGTAQYIFWAVDNSFIILGSSSWIALITDHSGESLSLRQSLLDKFNYVAFHDVSPNSWIVNEIFGNHSWALANFYLSKLAGLHRNRIIWKRNNIFPRA
jgi:hypothetical protein